MSPNALTSRSVAPSATRWCSANSGVALTKTSIFRNREIRELSQFRLQRPQDVQHHGLGCLSAALDCDLGTDLAGVRWLSVNERSMAGHEEKRP